jgi:toxin ParE1/3/4
VIAYRVVFTPEAMNQLSALYTVLAEASSRERASRYVDSVVALCEGLRHFPLRGARRDDIRPGLRLTHYRGRTTILFQVGSDEVATAVRISPRPYNSRHHPPESKKSASTRFRSSHSFG